MGEKLEVMVKRSNGPWTNLDVGWLKDRGKGATPHMSRVEVPYKNIRRKYLFLQWRFLAPRAGN
jgi:hypothetical protein